MTTNTEAVMLAASLSLSESDARSPSDSHVLSEGHSLMCVCSEYHPIKRVCLIQIKTHSHTRADMLECSLKGQYMSLTQMEVVVTLLVT